MVASISAKHPNLKVEVFTPPGRSVYLVSLGGDNMDREQAAKMLDKARSMGMPDDTYVQNFAE
jgi:eukaryotic-like serine/threonine-protein kinase